MKLKKTISAITITFFVMATTACSTNQVNQDTGSTSGSTNNTGTSQASGNNHNIGKTILGYALGFAIGSALAKAVSD